MQVKVYLVSYAQYLKKLLKLMVPCSLQLGMQVGTQWCFLGQLINYDSMPL
jgi:hypothetical protein